MISLRSLIATGCSLVMLLSVGAGYSLPAAQATFALRPSGRTEVVLDASGRGNHTTRMFPVPHNWTLQWQYACAGARAHFRIVVYSHTGQGAPITGVNKEGRAGHGTRHAHAGGMLYLTITSWCSWRFAVSREAPHMPTPTPTATPGRSSASRLALHVAGNQLVNQQGQTIRLIGVNVPASAQCIPTGPHTSPGIFAFPSATQTAAAIAGWHANVVRITVNEDCWLGINGGNPAYTGDPYRVDIANVVAVLHTRGIYAIIDLHTNAPGATPSTSQQVMADADHALAYWTSVADTFMDDPAVILEPYNEPHITRANAQTENPWQCWRDGCLADELDQYRNHRIPGATPWRTAGMQSLVDAIRAAGATNAILIDGLNWSQDLTQLLAYLPTDPRHQLIADYHNYMSAGSKNTPGYWDSVIAPVAARVPVMTSEFGEKDCGSASVTHYMQWADRHNISYIPWLWMAWPCGGMGLISNWDGTPSNYGRAFYDHFRTVSFSTG